MTATLRSSDPAYVFGASIGALIGLELIARHPGQVCRLIAHEPPIPSLLPEDLRAVLVRGQLDRATTPDTLPPHMRRPWQ